MNVASLPPMIVVGGVSGSGKSRVGKALADMLGGVFYDGDDYHPPANKEKMQHKQPLTDADRFPWLDILVGLMRARLDEKSATVVGCSALRPEYRNILRFDPRVHIALLVVPEDELSRRLSRRKGHFFPPELLESQLRTFVPPTDEENVFVVNGDQEPHEIAQEILARVRPATP